MNPEADADVVNYRTHGETSPSLLLAGHVWLGKKVAARLRRRFGWVAQEDLYSYALLGLSLAAHAYDARRGPFASFALHRACFLAIDEMRKDGVLLRRSVKPPPRFESLTKADTEGGRWQMDIADSRAEDAYKVADARDVCASLLLRLCEKDRRLMLMYYADQLTFREIADALDMSESTACLKHKKLLRKLRKLAKTLNVA